MKEATVLAKIVAAITGAVDFQESDHLVLHFREVRRAGEGVVIVDRAAGETTVITVSTERHVTKPAGFAAPDAGQQCGDAAWSPRGHCRG